ncbi:MAG: ATP-binding protein [Anaerolineae bacterium]|nr:ATP-binding protein [Anaerolineae bacterium]
MKSHQIESWALDVIERTLTGAPNEDSRVELKREWPEPPEKAARQIAGHANAARGASLLWLIGVDQRSGVVGVQHNELASWYSQINAQFEGLAPAMQDLNIPYNGVTVVALHFETDRVPFLVKNPAFGQQRGGPVEFEVPWREGTSTRTAHRSDLLSVLSPIAEIPEFEVLQGNLKIQDIGKEDLQQLVLELSLYVHKDSSDLLVIPFHQCSAWCNIERDDRQYPFDQIELSSPVELVDKQWIQTSKTIESTSTELLIHGPGAIELSAQTISSLRDTGVASLRHSVPIHISLQPSKSQYSIPIDVTLERRQNVPLIGETVMHYSNVWGLSWR